MELENGNRRAGGGKAERTTPGSDGEARGSSLPACVRFDGHHFSTNELPCNEVKRSVVREKKPLRFLAGLPLSRCSNSDSHRAGKSPTISRWMSSESLSQTAESFNDPLSSHDFRLSNPIYHRSSSRFEHSNSLMNFSSRP